MGGSYCIVCCHVVWANKPFFYVVHHGSQIDWTEWRHAVQVEVNVQHCHRYMLKFQLQGNWSVSLMPWPITDCYAQWKGTVHSWRNPFGSPRHHIDPLIIIPLTKHMTTRWSYLHKPLLSRDYFPIRIPLPSLH